MIKNLSSHILSLLLLVTLEVELLGRSCANVYLFEELPDFFTYLPYYIPAAQNSPYPCQSLLMPLFLSHSSIIMLCVSVRVFIAVKRHDNCGSSYKENI